MMEKTFNNYWNANHKKFMGEIKYDGWLEKWLFEIKKDDKILELGCGLGNNAKFLQERGFTELATDLSEVALESVKNYCPGIEIRCLDLTQPFPFKDDSFDVIIADLCLHYFSDQMTKKIMAEIRRVLKNGGKLYARVNSVDDINHGAGQGEKLEENYYYVEGYNKRFFDKHDIEKYFGYIGNCQFNNAIMKRYEKEKELIEVRAECLK